MPIGPIPAKVKIRRTGFLTAICLAALVAAQAVLGAEQAVTLWELQGNTNRIFILGSIHMLRSTDYPIPSVINSVYEEAEALIMELDLDDIDQAGMAALVLELGMLRDGKSLEDVIGKPAYAEALALADELEIPLALLANSKPWLAAVTVETLILTRVGFDPQYGVEQHLMSMAKRAHKEITGFETERQQLEMLDNLSPNAQRDMLLQTLADGNELVEVLDDIIDAWRNGDTAYLEETLLTDITDYPELYESIVVNRNRNWAQQIEALLDDDDDYLIVVGTMHLLGKDGVPMLLKNRGLEIRQMQQQN